MPPRSSATLRQQNEHLREQLNDNAKVYDEVAQLIEADPTGEIISMNDDELDRAQANRGIGFTARELGTQARDCA